MASPFPSLEGKYEILEKVHEGGMGSIYKVRHRLLDEIRVIKVMQAQHETDQALRARFLREAQLAVKLRHPNIAQMYDFAVDETGRAFIVMEFVNGISLLELLERIGPPPLGLALELAHQSLTALGFLHRKGIVHRDISPDNVMAAADDEGKPVVKLIDLGIAKVLAGGKGLTVTGTFLGKLRYASPEQFGADDIPIDQRSDIYSFGVVLYELLTSKHPITGSNPQELITGHILKPPADFAKTDPTGRVPEDLRQIVLKTMAKRPEDRTPSAEALDQALTEVQARYPLTTEEFTKALELPTALTQRIRVPAQGSTQDHFNEQFRLGATPTPVSQPGTDLTEATAPTLMFPPTGVVPPATGVAPKAPGSATGAEQGDEVTATALQIESAIAAGQLEQARQAIDTASASHGEHPEFERLRQLIEAAAQEDLGTQVVAPAAGTGAGARGTAGGAPTVVGEVPAVMQAAPKPGPQPARRVPWLLVGALVAVAVVAGGFFLAQGLLHKEPEKPSPLAAAPVAQPTPLPPAATVGAGRLQTAEGAFSAGRYDEARASIDALTPADLAALSPQAQARVQELRTALGQRRHEATADALDRAVSSGNLELLRNALAHLSRDERTALAGTAKGKQQLSLAQRAVELDASLARANREKNYLDVVQQATALVALLPLADQVKAERETAATAIEGEADALIRKGQTETGVERLEALLRVWPERPGLDKKLARARSDREADQRLAGLLALATRSEQEKRPEKGLDALQKAAPGPRWEERFNQERGRLTRLLAELDKEPPQVQLKPGFKLEYSKGKDITVPFRVTDDYAVKGVAVMARLEGASEYQPLAISSTGDGDYAFEVTLAFHNNKNVELYISAVDFSGHRAQLGDAERPLKLKRKWSLF